MPDQSRVFDPLGISNPYVISDTPLAISFSNYICDRIFYTENIIKLYAQYDNSGILLLNGDTAIYYLKYGTQITKIGEVSIYRIKSHSKGGQSAQRFNRIQQSQYASFCSNVADELKKLFIIDSVLKIKHLQIGAIGPTIKDIVLDSKFNAITSIEQISLMDPNLLKSQTKGQASADRKIINIINDALVKDMLVYGKEFLENSIEEGNLKYLIWHAHNLPESKKFKIKY